MGWRGQARLRPLETADSRYGSVREVQQSSEDSCSVAPSTHLSSPMVVEDVDTMSVLSYNRASVCLCVCMSVHSVSLSTAKIRRPPPGGCRGLAAVESSSCDLCVTCDPRLASSICGLF